MTDNITPLTPRAPPQPSPEVREVNELQARLNAAASIFGEKLIRSKTQLGRNNEPVVQLDIPKLYIGQQLLELQFNAMINLLVNAGVPRKVMLTTLAEAVERGVADLVTSSLTQPVAAPPAPNVLTP